MATKIATDRINDTANAPSISPDGIPSSESLPFDDSHGPLPSDLGNAPAPEGLVEKEPSVEPKADDVKPDIESEDDTTEPKAVDFSDFLKSKNTSEEEIPSVTKSKTDADKNEDEPIVAQHKPRKELVADDIKTRDITDIDADLAPHLQKEMSRKAFDKIAPIIREHKKLKAELDTTKAALAESSKHGLSDNYLSHPNAFVLSEDFDVASKRTNLAQEISNHWKSQATKVRRGAAEVDVINIDPNTGRVVVTGKIPVGDDTEEAIQEQFNLAQNQLINERAKLESLVNTHKERHSKAKQFIDEFDKTSFAHFYTEEGKKLMPTIDSIKEGFHPAFRNDPLMPVLAKSLFVNQQLTVLIKQLQANGGASGNTTKVVVKPSAQRKAGPTADDTGSSNSGSSKSLGEVTMDDFEAIKGGY